VHKTYLSPLYCDGLNRKTVTIDPLGIGKPGFSNKSTEA
jgi:hypothetical protein